MGKLLDRLRSNAATAGFVLLLVGFIGAVLLPSYRLASQLADSTAALSLVSSQGSQAELLQRSIAGVRDRLEAGGYVGQALSEVVARANAFDAGLASMEQASALESAEIATLRNTWSGYRAGLAGIEGFNGIPYADSDSGTQLNDEGRQLLDDARQAVGLGRSATPRLTETLTAAGARLEQGAVEGAAQLRRLMMVGVAFAALLVMLVAYFQWLRLREERRARAVREQMSNILETVRDGLFLLDADLRVGEVRSRALGSLLRRDSFEGAYFEDLLRDLVTPKTLDTAVKYVKLLWGERTNENLIRSINPLAEVEVTFDRGNGVCDTRYLEFEFHRVRAGQGVRQVLVSVNDVTSRVLLARDASEAQTNAQAHTEMLLGILKLDARQLASFLSDCKATLGQVNSILKVPARDASAYRDKVEQLFREMHRLKGEAATVGVTSVETRVHEFEDLLVALRQREKLDGNDLLPLVVRLDDLLAHLASIRELLERLGEMRTAAEACVTQMVPTMPVPEAPPDFGATLVNLAYRVATEQGKKVRLLSEGLDRVPAPYRRAVQDVVIQLLRNAIVHGIESPTQRRDTGKDETGRIVVKFASEGDAFALTMEDDGAGIVAEEVREAALRRGLITQDEAGQLDAKSVLALIFRPGFSTREAADRDAGRGVGLDLVRRTVQDLGGRVGLSTSPGRATRFRVLLPSEPVRAGAVA
jgi:HPt (histidine-containing phosphotransfer) domain-containing protein